MYGIADLAMITVMVAGVDMAATLDTRFLELLLWSVVDQAIGQGEHLHVKVSHGHHLMDKVPFVFCTRKCSVMDTALTSGAVFSKCTPSAR